MKGKILLLTGLAVGYVLGTRAGRERYEEIKNAATKLWADPRVQKPVKQAEEFVKDKAPEVAEFVSDGVKTVVSKVSGKPATPAKKPATRSTSARANSATASKPASTSK
jgi:hypothetical protein